MTPKPTHCKCDRLLVYPENLAEAGHTGCALTREKHEFSACPAKRELIKQAAIVIARLKEQPVA